MKRTIFLLLLVLLTIPAAVSANDWYIDGVAGDDSNAGTSADQALLTFDGYLPHHQDDDTLYICGTVTIRGEAALDNVAIKPCGEGVSPLILVTGKQASLELIDVGVDTSAYESEGSAIRVEDGAALRLGVDFCFSPDQEHVPLDMTGSGVNLDDGGSVYLISTGFEMCRMEVVPELPTATPEVTPTETAVPTETNTPAPTETDVPEVTPTATSTPDVPNELQTVTPDEPNVVQEYPDETPNGVLEFPDETPNGSLEYPNETPTPLTFIPFEPGEELPATGLSHDVLSEKPADIVYRPLDRVLQIPALNISADILSVPRTEDGYPVTWLGSFAGELEGIEGVTVIAAHNHLNETDLGPFALLSALEPGSRVFINDADGMQVYEVTANMKVASTDTASVNAAAVPGGLILITCEDEKIEGGYANRRVIVASAL